MLNKYAHKAPDAFWAQFPSNLTPPVPGALTEIDIEAYQRWIDKAVPYISKSELDLMLKSVSDLQNGADALVAEPLLPAVEVPNSKSLSKPDIGALFTDKIADWVEKKYVMGPYTAPPLPDFRSNSMFALIQNNKIRPIVNMSAPAGASFNEASLWLPKVEMASSKEVARRIYIHGPNCLLSKLDMVDA